MIKTIPVRIISVQRTQKGFSFTAEAQNPGNKYACHGSKFGARLVENGVVLTKLPSRVRLPKVGEVVQVIEMGLGSNKNLGFHARSWYYAK